MEMLRIRPFILYSDFVVIRSPKDEYFINNDEGFVSLGLDKKTNNSIIAIPLSKELILFFY